jgi:WD40 repeat protein
MLPLLFLLALAQQQGASALDSNAQALSPDEKLFAYAVSDGSLRVAELPAGKELWRASIGSSAAGGRVWDHWGGGLAFSADGQRLASLTIDGRLSVLQAADGTPVPGFALSRISTRDWRPRPWRTVSFLGGGERLLVVGPSAQLLDSATGAVLQEYPWSITASAVSLNGRHFALGDDNGVLAVYSGINGALEGKRLWLPRAIWALDFDANAKRLAVGAGDFNARVFDLPISAPPRVFSHWDTADRLDDGIGGVSFGADGESLLSSSMGVWEVRCWDLRRESLRWVYDFGGGNEGGMPASFTKDQSCVLLSKGGLVLDALTGKIVRDLGKGIGYREYSAGDDYAWTCSGGKITILEPRTGRLTCEIQLCAR